MLYQAIVSQRYLGFCLNKILLTPFRTINNSNLLDRQRYQFSKLKQVNDYTSFHSNQNQQLDQINDFQQEKLSNLPRITFQIDSLKDDVEQQMKNIIKESNKKAFMKNKLAAFKYNDSQSVYTNIMKCPDSIQFSNIFSKRKSLFSPRLYSIAGRKLMTLIAQQTQRKQTTLSDVFLEMFLLEMMRQSPQEVKQMYGPEQIKNCLLVIKRIKKRKLHVYKKLEDNIVIFIKQLINLVQKYISYYTYSELSQVFMSCIYLDNTSESIEFYQNMSYKLQSEKIDQSFRKLYCVSHLFESLQYIKDNQCFSSSNQKKYQKKLDIHSVNQRQNTIQKHKTLKSYNNVPFKKEDAISKQFSLISQLQTDYHSPIISSQKHTPLFVQKIKKKNQKISTIRYDCYQKSYKLYIDYLEELNWKNINSNWINGDINHILDSYEGIHLTINKYGIQYLNIVQKVIQKIEKQTDNQKNKLQSQDQYQKFKKQKYLQINTSVFKKIKQKKVIGKKINKQKCLFKSLFNNSSRVIKLHFIVSILSIRLENIMQSQQKNINKQQNNIIQKTLQEKQLINRFKRYSQQNLQQLMVQSQIVDHFKRNLIYFRKYRLISQQQHTFLQNNMKEYLTFSKIQDQNNQKYWNS